MLPEYEDILALADRAGVKPFWWDEHGVPRFAPFHPSMLGVYDYYAVLAEVVCASCDKRMLVGIGRPKMELKNGLVEWDLPSVVDIVEAWGDPPRHDFTPGHGCAGETMSVKEVKVLETWAQVDFEWVRWPAPADRCVSERRKRNGEE